MNVIAFLGSPRKGGNTETLLKEAVRGVRASGFKVRIFDLNRMNIAPCQNCGGCNKTGRCVVKDDMQKVSQAIRKADRIILTSPVFFSGLSAQVKTMIDRCQQFWCEKYILKKPIAEGQHGRKGLLIIVGGQKKPTGVKCSEATAIAFFRTVSVPEHKTLSFTGIDAKGEILLYPDALNEAFEAGRELVK
jgi:multimeric flavodoxin WrbA